MDVAGVILIDDDAERVLIRKSYAINENDDVAWLESALSAGEPSMTAIATA